MGGHENRGLRGQAWMECLGLSRKQVHAKQGEISFDTALKDEHLTHTLYTCFVAGSINIIFLLFRHYKYYLIPTLFSLLPFYICFLGDSEMT